MDITFTAADDPAVLADCNKEIQDFHHRLFPGEFRPWARETVTGFFREALGWDNHYFYIIRVDKAVSGYFWYEFKKRREHPFKLDSNILFIHQVCVFSRLQRNGIGRRAMDFMEEQAEIAVVDRVMLDYWEGNPAEEFYERLGYVPVNRVMGKELSGGFSEQ